MDQYKRPDLRGYPDTLTGSPGRGKHKKTPSLSEVKILR